MAFLLQTDFAPDQAGLTKEFLFEIEYLDLSFMDSSGKVHTAVVGFSNTFARGKKSWYLFIGHDVILQLYSGIRIEKKNQSLHSQLAE